MTDERLDSYVGPLDPVEPIEFGVNLVSVDENR